MEANTKEKEMATNKDLSPQTAAAAAATTLWTSLGVTTVDGGIPTHPFQSQVAFSVVKHLRITMVVAAR